MGFADRQYARRPSPPSGAFGAMRMWSVTTWLIVINIAVYLLNPLTGDLLKQWGYFSAATVIYGLQLWRFITFQFLHAGFQHILFNMISLYFFGPIIEGYLGSARYLAFYLLCGIGGGLAYLLLCEFGVLYDSPSTALIGASAGIFGVLVAAARIAPDTTVMLIFPPIPLKLKVVALIMLAVAVWVVIGNGVNAGGQAAHLGGAAMGLLLIMRPELLNVFARLPGRRRKRRFFTDDFR